MARLCALLNTFRCADNSTGAFTRSGPYSYQVRLFFAAAWLRLSAACGSSRAACSHQVCEEQPGEVPGVNVTGGGSRCIPVRLCAARRIALRFSLQLSDSSAQIDPGSLTFCTGVSYVSCLRVPVPATYDTFVSDVRAARSLSPVPHSLLPAALGRRSRCARRDLVWSFRPPGRRFARPHSSRTSVRSPFRSVLPSTASTWSSRYAGHTACRVRWHAPARQWPPRRAQWVSRHGPGCRGQASACCSC